MLKLKLNFKINYIVRNRFCRSVKKSKTHFEQRVLVRSERDRSPDDLVEHIRDGDHQRLAIQLPIELIQEQERLLILIVSQVVC